MNPNKQQWKTINLSNLAFLDVETASGCKSFDELSPRLQEFWLGKAAGLKKREQSDAGDADFYFDNASLYSEFGRVLCVSIGVFTSDDGLFVVKSFAGDDERQVLHEVADVIKKMGAIRPVLCGHNIKEFDIPYLARRMVINEVSLPTQLDLAGLRPWDVPHIDTFELWRFGDAKSYTKLDLILEVLGLPSSKNDISGADVNRVFWHDNGLERIVRYCEGDVVAVANVLLRLRGEPALEDARIEHRPWPGE